VSQDLDAGIAVEALRRCVARDRSSASRASAASRRTASTRPVVSVQILWPRIDRSPPKLAGVGVGAAQLEGAGHARVGLTAGDQGQLDGLDDGQEARRTS
jgi:hypothetical protein